MAGAGGSSRSTTTYLALGLLAAAASGVALWYALSLSKVPPSTKKVLDIGDEFDDDIADDIANDEDKDSTVVKEPRKEVDNDPTARDTVPAPDQSVSEKDGAKTTEQSESTKDDEKTSSSPTPVKSNMTPSKAKPSSVSSGGSSTSDEERALHRKIEEIDRRGKVLFKKKKFMEAADAFTEALDLIATRTAEESADSKESSSLTRQIITLTNNRSAMYEKASHPDLALADCDAVLRLDVTHVKARTRRLRVLESQDRHSEALIEVCALQLKYMHDNRDKLRLGLAPSGPPPVAQSKIEELVGKILPGAVAEAQAEADLVDVSSRALPSRYTVVQLLKSFSGYARWMAAAARGGKLGELTEQLDGLVAEASRGDLAPFAEEASIKAGLLYKRGRRRAFEKDFKGAVHDLDEAYAILSDKAGGESGEDDHDAVAEAIADALGKDDCVRLMEWVGMGRHLRYDLDGAMECYEKCSDLEPTNTELLVKRAGVKMDGGKHAEAELLFESALGLDPNAPDALLHRANLRMLQQRTPDSKADLERCLRLYPDNSLARLRLATVLMATEDIEGAQRLLDEAETYDPDSSEVHCYRGEMHCARGEFVEARSEFDKAAECDGDNPTPYVNAALAVMNSPPPEGARVPDVAEAVRLLEKAIDVDPMFHAAYAQLGQLKLSIATDLEKAREVVALYDGGLEHCRTAEELKEICSMRAITVAQIEAAHALKMETLSMQ